MICRYLKTIDISHDHFGFYLAWGSAAFLPTMYTLQPQYLMKHPIQLSPLSLGMVSFLGIGGYALFRSVNLQKHRVRLANGNCQIWGKPAKVMYCNYETADGRKHTAPLLLSGKNMKTLPQMFVCTKDHLELTMYRMVGNIQTLQLSWRLDDGYRDVRNMWWKRRASLVLLVLHDCYLSPSLLS